MAAVPSISTVELSLIENQDRSWTFDFPGVADITGYTARMEWTISQAPSVAPLLTLTSSPPAGIVLTQGSGVLLGTFTLTEAQADLLVAAAMAARPTARHVWTSLKLTAPSGTSTQVWIAKLDVVRTPTR